MIVDFILFLTQRSFLYDFHSAFMVLFCLFLELDNTLSPSTFIKWNILLNFYF